MCPHLKTQQPVLPYYVLENTEKILKCSEECCYCIKLVGVAFFAKVQGLEGFADFQAVQVNISTYYVKDVTSIDVKTFCDDFLKNSFVQEQVSNDPKLRNGQYGCEVSKISIVIWSST